MSPPSLPRSHRLLLAATLLFAPRLAAGAGPVPAQAPQPAETYAHFKDGRKLPLFTRESDPTPVAKVGTEVVTLRDLTDALAVAHQERGARTAGEKDFTAILERLVDLQLVVLEAQAMGIPELPEFRSAMAAAEDRMLREALKQKVVAGVRPDPREVERASRDALREWKIRSILFQKAEDARRLHAALKGGARFEQLARKAHDEKKARGGLEPALLRETQLPLELRKALRKLPAGAATAPVKIEGGFLVAQVLGQRQVRDPQERSKIEASVAAAARLDVLRRYYRTLVKKYAKVDERLLQSLDLQMEKPGLEGLEKDDRTLAQIEGEKPIKVSELVAELRGRFFHGVERQAKRGKLAARKQSTFDDMLEKRLFSKEARQQGLHGQADFKRQLKEYADQLAVSATIERVVLPEVKVTDDEVRQYYQKHRSELTTPLMLKLEGLAFARQADAEEAVKKLRAGTDFKWLAANAEGQLDRAKQPLQLDGSTVSANDFPRALADALAGAKAGDFRLYADPGGAHYAIHVIEQFPPQVRPFEAVKDSLAGKAQSEKLNEAFRQWTGKLRQHYPVEILIARFGS